MDNFVCGAEPMFLVFPCASKSGDGASEGEALNRDNDDDGDDDYKAAMAILCLSAIPY